MFVAFSIFIDSLKFFNIPFLIVIFVLFVLIPLFVCGIIEFIIVLFKSNKTLLFVILKHKSPSDSIL